MLKTPSQALQQLKTAHRQLTEDFPHATIKRASATWLNPLQHLIEEVFSSNQARSLSLYAEGLQSLATSLKHYSADPAPMGYNPQRRLDGLLHDLERLRAVMVADPKPGQFPQTEIMELVSLMSQHMSSQFEQAMQFCDSGYVDPLATFQHSLLSSLSPAAERTSDDEASSSPSASAASHPLSAGHADLHDQSLLAAIRHWFDQEERANLSQQFEQAKSERADLQQPRRFSFSFFNRKNEAHINRLFELEESLKAALSSSAPERSSRMIQFAQLLALTAIEYDQPSNQGQWAMKSLTQSLMSELGQLMAHHRVMRTATAEATT